MTDLKKFGFESLSQMALDLGLEEVEDNSISPAEAQRRSGVALDALKMRMASDDERVRQYYEDVRTYNPESKDPRPVYPTDLIGWWNDFFRLRDAGWSWRVAAYIAWASSPKQGRWPKSQDELARDVLGLTSDRQIATWRRKHPEIDETIGLMQAIPLMDHRADVFRALAESASDPSSKGAQDRKTFLSMTQDYVPRQKVELERTKSDPKDFPEDELRKMLEDSRNDQ